MTENMYEQRRRRAQERYQRSGRAQQPSAPETAAQTDADVYEAARNIVLRQLTASAKSRRQLEDKLADRGVPENVAMAVLDRFEDVGLVDDAAFAQAFVRSRAETRKLARPALRRDLQAKGIDPELVEEALEQRTDHDERADALELVRRKAPSGEQLTEQLADRASRDKLTRRLVSMLARKGYAPGMAFDVVKEVLAESPPT
ncbi:regulatory protein RecX [Kocuria sp.]|uniref:regulatory protein RecX n=1 Tax=Kocuria sp. TaxID=1871328 RepID=UPI0026E06335|nr:regulatory protein RecX [Kocuria sp.]MDO5618736.1 regulatory protein RecX [Kocuria sp.]